MDPLIAQVETWFWEDPEFSASFEKWADDHCGEIDNDSEECKLVYTSLHKEFSSLYEHKLTEYLEESCSSSVQEFYEKLQRAPRDGKEGQFVEMMLMMVDFDAFMAMMRDAKSRSPRPSP
eukprot:TRINITY_DN17788_c0_g1_i4.p1 TRINITY_DN17788_c0_g1~~TRINITY_DN17788_c0_g1_i4.p1  ORF type:complete len:120 (-),score=27.38 TRINITY_DN17788_c0_g1_i4:258-617(-)